MECVSLSSKSIVNLLQQKLHHNNKYKVIAGFSACSIAYFASCAITASKINCDDLFNAYNKCRASDRSFSKLGANNPSLEIVYQVTMLPWHLLASLTSCSRESQDLSACQSSQSLLIPMVGIIASLAIGCFAIKKLTRK